jgi:hypothetical protein
MFPNVRLMIASTLVSVIALFFAFGVYASLRVSHEPLARSAHAGPLQLVGFNVAMLPVTVLEPFADKHATQAVADNGSALAYSAAQTTAPQQAPPVAAAAEVRADNSVDEPTENSDVTQLQITESVETAREIKVPDATIQERFEPAEKAPQSIATVATPPALPPAAPVATVEPPQVAPPEAPTKTPPQASPVEHTATIESVLATTAEPAAADDDTATDSDLAPKKKKKKHVARRHLYRTPLRTAAQTAAPQPATSSIWPAGIGGPLVTTPKR